MVGEADFIQHYLTPLVTTDAALELEDDAALLKSNPEHDIVISKDLLVENIHFLKNTLASDIAYKALAVNLSDIAAKAARPLGFLCGLSMKTAPTEKWAKEFTASLKDVITKYDCPLLGGDTTGGKGGLTLSITILGEVPKDKMVKRKGANPGDQLFLSGSVGDAALGLHVTNQPEKVNDWNLNEEQVSYLKERYHRPTPRLELINALSEHATAAMDISDGLYNDLPKLCKASNVTAEIECSTLPLSPAFRAAKQNDPELTDLALCWGDDYEILAAIPQSRAEQYIKEAAENNIPVTYIGQVKPGKIAPLYFNEGQQITINDQKSYAHF